MRAKPTLVARVKHAGGFPRVPVETSRNAIKLPIKALGESFTLDQVSGFYARYSQDGKRHITPLGQDPVAAWIQFERIKVNNTLVRANLPPLPEQPDESTDAEPKEDRTLKACADKFMRNYRSLGKKRATIIAYGNTLNALVSQFPGKIVDKITEQDMLDHVDYLRANLNRKKYGDNQRTIRNRVNYLSTFFLTLGLKNPLSLKKLKKPVKPKKTRYSESLVNKMLSVASEDEKDLILFFVHTGFRDEEVAYTKWTDIDFEAGSINVSAKPEYDWSPKDNEPRQQDITLDARFVRRMKARLKTRREHGVTSELIFTNERGGPNAHLLDTIKDVAARAGITDKRITLHAFRRTFCNMVAKVYGIEQARIWLGHSDIATTQDYLACEEMTNEESRKKIKEVFAGIGD